MRNYYHQRKDNDDYRQLYLHYKRSGNDVYNLFNNKQKMNDFESPPSQVRIGNTSPFHEKDNDNDIGDDMLPSFEELSRIVSSPNHYSRIVRDQDPSIASGSVHERGLIWFDWLFLMSALCSLSTLVYLSLKTMHRKKKREARKRSKLHFEGKVMSFECELGDFKSIKKNKIGANLKFCVKAENKNLSLVSSISQKEKKKTKSLNTASLEESVINGKKRTKKIQKETISITNEKAEASEATITKFYHRTGEVDVALRDCGTYSSRISRSDDTSGTRRSVELLNKKEALKYSSQSKDDNARNIHRRESKHDNNDALQTDCVVIGKRRVKIDGFGEKIEQQMFGVDSVRIDSLKDNERKMDQIDFNTITQNLQHLEDISFNNLLNLVVTNDDVGDDEEEETNCSSVSSSSQSFLQSPSQSQDDRNGANMLNSTKLDLITWLSSTTESFTSETLTPKESNLQKGIISPKRVRFEKNVTVYSPQPITTLAPKTKLWYTHKDFDSFEDSFDREREKDFEHDERV